MKKNFYLFLYFIFFESLSIENRNLDAKLTKFDSFNCSELNTKDLESMIKMNVLLFKNLAINMKLSLTIMIKYEQTSDT